VKRKNCHNSQHKFRSLRTKYIDINEFSLTLYIPAVITSSARFITKKSTFCSHSVIMCFVWIWEQRAIISLNSINLLFFVTVTEWGYCAVRTWILYIIQVNPHSTNAPHSYSFTRCSYQKDKRAIPGKPSKTSSLLEIGEHSIEMCFHLASKF
jgi:hypothetical protein